MFSSSQAKRLLLVLAVLSCVLSDLLHDTHAYSKEGSLRNLLTRLSSVRNERMSMSNMTQARDYLTSVFDTMGLHTWQESFLSPEHETSGYNIVGRVAGRYTGTLDDRVLIIGAHYDTTSDTPGVDDNGSGIAALVQVAKIYMDSDMVDCERNHTLMFVAFDRKECQAECIDPDPRKCVCSYGSLNFIANLTNYLPNKEKSIRGAIILDSILNFDSNYYSQNVTNEMVLMAQQLSYRQPIEIRENNYKGDFLMALTRQTDSLLQETFIRSVSRLDGGQFTVRPFLIDITGRPSEGSSSFFHRNIGEFYHSDHYRFWDNNPPVPALYLTDTGNLRGYMRYCYHNSCDDMDYVTGERIQFLSSIADALAETARDFTQEIGCTNRTIDYVREYLNRNSGEFTTPAFPNLYPNNADCVWVITVDAGLVVELVFVEFFLEDNACISDYVEVRNGADRSGSILGRFCGSSRPTLRPRSTGRNMYISFRSDTFDAYKGFKAAWNARTVSAGAVSSPFAVLLLALTTFITAIISRTP
ncbi:uncharacterized protein LOC116621096 [Nematostella vectensis]|uniref:uncharacterized protein LOC116621096 n=1 Tax=Nematostella vectensis TaxID=45351 RepID=UPI002077225A|nr:uncharacterized protein LOC116621096 [Nematostella vectensis]